MKKLIYTIAVVLGLSLLPVNQADASDWKSYSTAINYKNANNCTAAIPHFQKAIELASGKASYYRPLAQCYEALGQFQNAANTYYKEAEVHKKLGATQTYLATKQIADNLNSEVDVFVEVDKVNTTSLAKYEPAAGAYFGAFIQHDSKYVNTPSAKANIYTDFNNYIGKQHATFFVYHSYGSAFPELQAQRVKEAGGALQIAFQPENGLSEVTDSKYLRDFAKAAKESGIPIFIRFAAEMNGDWVKWHGNPTLYKQKFQLVAKVLREEAPNIAMVWAPNSMPAATIHDYYPGDAAVDWVGMNVYSNPYNNGQKNIPTDQVNPLTFLDEVYNKYTNKPMMIAEFGASHYSQTTDGSKQDQTKFGDTKMRQFYEGIRLKYPRVKSVHWFSVNTLTSKYVGEGRRLNNFSLTENATITNTYKEIIGQDYFLKKVVNGPLVGEATAGKGVINLANATLRTNDTVNIATYVKTYDPFVSKVVYVLNGKTVGTSTKFPYDLNVAASNLAASNTLNVNVYDSKGRVATTKTVYFKKSAAVPTLPEGEMRLFLNDKQAYIKDGSAELLIAPFTNNGRTLVPIRFISENFGAKVDYTSLTKPIVIKKGNTTVTLTINQTTGTINGKTVSFEAAPIVKNGTTFVPLRFIGEALNVKIDYTAATQQIKITQ